MAPYTLVRMKRKTLGIYIRNGNVEVRAPLKLSKREIDRFIASKEDWINERLADSRKRMKQREVFALDYDSHLLYRGQEFPLAAKSGTRAGFDGTAFYFPPNLNDEQLKQTCIKIYRNLAKADLTERVTFYGQRMGVMPATVKINSAKTRFCSAGGTKRLSIPIFTGKPRKRSIKVR